ncbi:major facilitator superfamily domain-containing protein 6-like [Procambarus clarkii]|uniref:major facilitator superfamily domain-containing protein 6-like n=1 Tax=Procambarus clarkii TaxID=6728 RepID=UPI00374427F2
MKINKAFIPLKAHYFCFFGCVSPVLPFLMVVGIQLGIPVSVTGSLSGIALMLVVLMKPVIATIADAFPARRRAIFLLTLVCMVACYSSISFIPPMKEELRVSGNLVKAHDSLTAQQWHAMKPPSVSAAGDWEGARSQPLLLTRDDGGCYIAKAWDCTASCSQSWACLLPNTSTPDLRLNALAKDHSLEIYNTTEAVSSHTSISRSREGELFWRHEAADEATAGVRSRLYQLEGLNVSWDLLMANVSVECGGGQWEGSRCASVWTYWEFWIYTCLLFVGQIVYSTANSITDAITVDTIGKDGNYGIQRAWGNLPFGVIGPINGLLIDWWSGTSLTKDYAPAFLICALMGSIDIIISATAIKVPEMKTEHDILNKMLPILRQPRFFMFCCFVFMNGFFDGAIVSYVFVMQEDMARGTDAMSYMKFFQGMTQLVQCSSEVPFMFISQWFLKRLGTSYLMSLVFFLYILRLMGLAIVGTYGLLWGTMVLGLFNGPCFGLGFIAIVVHSAKISPPGTSTTVQSLVNICFDSIGYGSASLLGGLLYSSLGGPNMYLVVGIIAVITLVLHLASHKLFPPVQEPGMIWGLRDRGEVEDTKNTQSENNESTAGGKDVDSVELQLEETHDHLSQIK